MVYSQFYRLFIKRRRKQRLLGGRELMRNGWGMMNYIIARCFLIPRDWDVSIPIYQILPIAQLFHKAPLYFTTRVE